MLLLGDEYDVPPDATAGTGDGEDGIDEDDLLPTITDGEEKDGDGSDGGEKEGGEEKEVPLSALVNLMADEEALGDPVVDTQEPLKERMQSMAEAYKTDDDLDSGVGVFGAMKHLEKDQAMEDALLAAAFGDLYGEGEGEDEVGH